MFTDTEERPPASSHGDLWRRFDAIERRLSAPLTERMLDSGRLEAGMSVLDLAAGRGEPAVPAARRVYPGGRVLGIDIDRSVLQIARERAEREGITGLDLAVSDAESLDAVPSGAFDAALCRWGLMYLRRPPHALRSVRKSLVTGGPLVVAVWTDPDNASFHTLPRETLSKLWPVPATDLDSPGPFFYADADRLFRDLENAGFKVRSAERLGVDVMEATSDAGLIDWCRSIGIPRLLRGVPDTVQAAWEHEVVRAAEPFRRGDGSVRLGGTSLLVTAV